MGKEGLSDTEILTEIECSRWEKVKVMNMDHGKVVRNPSTNHRTDLITAPHNLLHIYFTHSGEMDSNFIQCLP